MVFLWQVGGWMDMYSIKWFYNVIENVSRRPFVKLKENQPGCHKWPGYSMILKFGQYHYPVSLTLMSMSCYTYVLFSQCHKLPTKALIST